MIINSCVNPWAPRNKFDETKKTSMMEDENLLVEELNGLTVKEREEIFEEVHGVVDVIEETPEFVAERLQAMRDELSKVPKNKKKALDRAIFLRPSIQLDDKLHLLFLRARRFDPVKASTLMYKHYENKLELFGENLLVKRITLDDLTEQEMEFVRTGSAQTLRGRERAGRGILFMTVALYDVRDWKAFIRYLWYQVNIVVEEDEEVQKTGMVQIAHFYGNFRETPGQLIEFLWRTNHILQYWPFRVGGMHLCFDNPTFRTLVSGINIIAGKDVRLRERCHFGSPLEAAYAMLSFGIRTHDCFTLGEGIMSPRYIEAFIKERRKKEAEWREREWQFEKPTSRFALHPNPNDVLMGRGKPFREWSGNMRLAKIVSLHALRYSESTKERIEKTVIAMQIVHMIENDDGGRFLQRKMDGWEVVEDAVAKEKVSQALRTEARLMNKTITTTTGSSKGGLSKGLGISPPTSFTTSKFLGSITIPR